MFGLGQPQLWVHAAGDCAQPHNPLIGNCILNRRGQRNANNIALPYAHCGQSRRDTVGSTCPLRKCHAGPVSGRTVTVNERFNIAALHHDRVEEFEQIGVVVSEGSGG